MLKHSLVAVGLVGGLVGCIDPRGAFNDFSDRTGVTDASTIDGPGGSIFPITGTFLLAVHAGFETSNDPAFYIQFVTTFELTATGDTALLDGSYVPLCTHATCSERTMLPPALVDNDRAVAADGTFAQPVVGMIPGGANPISGTPAALDGLLNGTIISADLICGSVSGEAADLDLAGSTFAAIRVTDTTPAALPAPTAACPASMPTDAGVDAPIDAPIDAAAEIDAI